MKYLTKIAASMLGLTLLSVASAQESTTVRLRGAIVSLNNDVLTVHRHSGDTAAITLGADSQISAVRRIRLSDIKAGSFIGTAATTDTQGKITAQEVHVFPEAERGTGEGHYAWDLGPTSSMTNANVDAVVQGTSGNDLHLTYKGGTQTITVPPTVPVVTFVPATRADLAEGKRVFVIASPAGADRYVARRVIVEKDGVVPPM